MTEALLFRSRGRLVGFECRGHAGAGESGQDIVCSAVSALTITTINGLIELLKLSCAVDTDDGRLYCMLDSEVNGNELEKAELLLETMALGLRSIAEEYGRNLKISEREV